MAGTVAVTKMTGIDLFSIVIQSIDIHMQCFLSVFYVHDPMGHFLVKFERYREGAASEPDPGLTLTELVM